MARKQPVNLRLTDEARQLLDDLAQRKGVSKTAVIEMAVRAYAETEGMRPRQTAAPSDDHQT
jgi:predicted transcriptional regulator